MFRDDRPHSRRSGGASLAHRAEAQAALREKIRSGASLITLVGPGGIGKSRLLRWVHAEVPEAAGAIVVSLAGVDDETGLLAAFAKALGLPDEATEPALRVRAFLATEGDASSARPWVLLDDVDGVRDPLLALLDAAADLRFVATSREPLGVPGEQVVAVEGLSPEDAVAFFRACVGSEAPTLDDRWIEELTQRVEGSPLAIEIAASWLSVLSPEELSRRFSIHLPRAGTPRTSLRHATLRDAVQGSWDLLDEPTRAAVCALAPLPDGFTLSLAEAATGLPDDAMLHIVDELRRRSLLRRVSAEGAPRFHLYRAVRELAQSLPQVATRLQRVEEAVLGASGETANLWAIVRREHRAGVDDPASAERIVRAALRIHADLLRRGPLPAHLPLLLRARDLAAREEHRTAVTLALGEVYRMRGELGHLATELARVQDAVVPPDLRARSLHLRGWLARMQGDLPRALEHYEAAVAAARAAGDAPALAIGLGEQAFVRQSAGDLESALVLHFRALELHRTAGDRRRIGIELSYIAVATHRLGRMREALVLHDEALALHLATGNVRYAAAERMHRAFVLFELGDLDSARDAYEAALTANVEVHDAVLEALAQVGASLVEGERGGEVARRAAAASLARAENVLENMQNARMSSAVAVARGHQYLAAGAYDEALASYAAAQAASREIVVGPEALVDTYRALAAFGAGRLEEARRAHG
ncbi:MAG: AAA family ATPase, partial [Polyangiaceae bacterium]|nr:AAA family ATPase [Polyangiaceae bacterium]